MNRTSLTLLAVLAAITLAGALSGCGTQTAEQTAHEEGWYSQQQHEEAQAERRQAEAPSEPPPTTTTSTSSTTVGGIYIPGDSP